MPCAARLSRPGRLVPVQRAPRLDTGRPAVVSAVVSAVVGAAVSAPHGPVSRDVHSAVPAGGRGGRARSGTWSRTLDVSVAGRALACRSPVQLEVAARQRCRGGPRAGRRRDHRASAHARREGRRRRRRGHGHGGELCVLLGIDGSGTHQTAAGPGHLLGVLRVRRLGVSRTGGLVLLRHVAVRVRDRDAADVVGVRHGFRRDARTVAAGAPEQADREQQAEQQRDDDDAAPLPVTADAHLDVRRLVEHRLVVRACGSWGRRRRRRWRWPSPRPAPAARLPACRNTL